MACSHSSASLRLSWQLIAKLWLVSGTSEGLLLKYGSKAADEIRSDTYLNQVIFGFLPLIPLCPWVKYLFFELILVHLGLSEVIPPFLVNL